MSPDRKTILGRDLRFLVGFRGSLSFSIAAVYQQLIFTNEFGFPRWGAIVFVASLAFVLSLLSTPAGLFADRRGHKGCLIAGAVCCVTGFCLWGLAQDFGLPLLLVGYMVVICGWALAYGLDSALASDISKTRGEDGVFEHFGVAAVRATAFGKTGGSIVGAILVGSLGLPVLFWAQAIAYLPMIATSSLVRKGQHKRKKPSIKETFGGLWSRRPLLTLLMVSAVVMAATDMAWNFMLFYLAGVRFGSHKIPTAGIGYVWAAYQLSMFAIRQKFRNRLKKKFKPRTFFAVLIGVVGACYLALATTNSVIGLILTFPIFLVMPIQGPAIMSLLNERLNEGEEATIFSLSLTLNDTATFFGSLIVSGVIGFAGMSAGLLSAGALVIGCGSLAVWRLAVTEWPQSDRPDS